MEQIEQKGASKRSQKWKKSYDLGGDWTLAGYNNLGLREVHKSPQLFISGFDRNVAQLFSDPSLHQCLHRPIKSEQKHVLICYNNTRVARWWAFNFAKVPPRYVLCMDELKSCFKKVFTKRYWVERKKSVNTWIWTHDLLHASQAFYHLNSMCCGFQRNVAQVFSTPWPSTRCRDRTEARVNSW